MARARRHFIPGYIWQITHPYSKREFLLKFAKDRHRYLHWLYQAKKRYGLNILNYMVTSNHSPFSGHGRKGRISSNGKRCCITSARKPPPTWFFLRPKKAILPLKTPVFGP